ncbi:MAG: alkaline phosphatase family protein [Lutibacter sp.]|uniref:alkaline phosphatase D family protein n=1 Tax=Lutibacter sp. TaxID=1925666 RepID=UPI0019FD582F|nr:alkaline phosphatase D family protein [Lutibacter sp.]NOR27123.1 alkaline phosphatase family protein [Lutibacter sp.]
MKKLTSILFIFSFSITFAQKTLLQSGPMVGYAEKQEVLLWVQTTKNAEVKFKYWPKSDTKNVHWSNTIKTKKEDSYVAKFILDEVKPGTSYNYELSINNKKIAFDYDLTFKTQELWRWRKDAPNFKFAFGSCTYINDSEFDRPGTPYGSNYQIFESIRKKQPDFMLWGGDNLYLRQDEWNSRTGFNYRYTKDRSLPELQALLASTSNYAILDDHDFGADNSDGSFWNKNMSLEFFENFWGNPSVGIGNIKGAISFFSWNDADFFLLDNRYHRNSDRLKSDNKTILGKEQLSWLKNALASSNANFKFVVIGGQVLNTSKSHENYINNGFDKERLDILNFIQNQQIKGVIFLTGDRHHTEMSLLKDNNKVAIYDLTVSPFTSGVGNKDRKEKNSLRVENTMVTQHNFSTIEFSGDWKNRQATITIFDADGEKIWEQVIKKSDF